MTATIKGNAAQSVPEKKLGFYRTVILKHTSQSIRNYFKKCKLKLNLCVDLAKNAVCARWLKKVLTDLLYEEEWVKFHYTRKGRLLTGEKKHLQAVPERAVNKYGLCRAVFTTILIFMFLIKCNRSVHYRLQIFSKKKKYHRACVYFYSIPNLT